VCVCIYIYIYIYIYTHTHTHTHAYRLKFHMERKLHVVIMEIGILEGNEQNASQEGPRSSEFVRDYTRSEKVKFVPGEGQCHHLSGVSRQAHYPCSMVHRESEAGKVTNIRFLTR